MKGHNLVKKVTNMKVFVSRYLGQDAGDGLIPKHYNCVEIHQSAAQFVYILSKIGNRVRKCQWISTLLSAT